MGRSKKKTIKPKRDILERAADVYLALLIPLLILYPGWEGYETIDQAKYRCFLIINGGYVVISLLLWMETLLIGQRKFQPPKAIWKQSGWVQRLIVLYLLLTLASSLLSDFSETWIGMSRKEGFLTIAICGLTFLLLSVYGRAKAWMVYLLGAVMSLCCIVSMLQLCGFNPLGLYPDGLTYQDAGVLYTGEYLGTVGNADILSALLCLTIPMFAATIWKGRSRRRFVLLLPLVLCLTVLLWSKVAAGYAALIAGTLICVPVLLENKRHRIIAGVGSVAVTPLGLLAIYWIDPGSGTLQELHLLLHGQIDLSFGSGRLLIWSQVLEILPEHLLFGIGPDTLLGAGLDGFRRYDPVQDLLVVAPVDLAHNEYLNILVSQGVFALAAYLAALVLSAIGWIRHADQTVIAICGCGILWYCIQVFFGFSLYFTAPLFWATWALMHRELLDCNRKREQT